MKKALKKLLGLGLCASMVLGSMMTTQATEEPLLLFRKLIRTPPWQAEMKTPLT